MNSQTSKPVAIVTGASSGIGKACAELLASNNFSVVLAARSEGAMNNIKDSIIAKGGDAIVITTDVSDEQQTHALIEKTMENYGRIDVLINNAGYSPAAALEQLSRTEIKDVFEVNLFPLMQLTSEVIPIMRKQGAGRIIQMGSITSHISSPLACPYAATKGAIEAMTNCLRLELMPWNINLSLILPGIVDTPIFDKSRACGEKLRNDPSNPYQRLMNSLNDFATEQLAGKPTTPEDVAQSVLHAATAEKPDEYYYLPLSSKIMKIILAFLSPAKRDWLLDQVYGLSKLLKTANKGSW